MESTESIVDPRISSLHSKEVNDLAKKINILSTDNELFLTEIKELEQEVARLTSENKTVNQSY